MSLEQVVAIISIISAIISSVVALVAILLAYASNRHAQKIAIKESTDIIFKEWWSEDLRQLRKYFFMEFIPIHRKTLIGKGMKDIDQIIPEDKGRATQFCYFFDRIGWLGAARLIDVDYVLGPMQHVLRRTWIVMEPLIVKEREIRSDRPFDPVYQYGFDWLFKRTNRPNRNQANLLDKMFLRPSIRSQKEISNLKSQISLDEANFRRELQKIFDNDNMTTTYYDNLGGAVD